MSNLLYKTRCESCAASGKDTSGNGMAVYDDGHKYCFKCNTRGEYGASSSLQGYIPNQMGSIYSNKNEYKGSVNDFEGEIVEIEERGISEEICKFLEIQSGTLYGKEAQLYVYDNGYKVRFLPKDFQWLEGQAKECSMFALDQCVDYSQPIIITEGELDAASCWQVGYQACSLHSGFRSVEQCITHDKDKLLKFKEIWLGFDNDEQGREATTKALDLLPLDKIKIIDWGENKDANEALLSFTLEDTLKLKVKEWRPEGIVFGDELDWKEIWKERPEGLQLPWKKIQEMIKGLHKGRLYLFGGGASIGKSSVLRELSYFLRIENPELKIAHLFLEEDYEAGPLTYIALNENIPLGDLLENKDLVPQSRRNEIQDILNNNTMFTNEQYELGSDDLLKQLEWLATVKKYDIIILDHISMVAEASESKDSERVLINKLMLKLRSLVRRTGLIVVAACHLSNPEQGLDWEDGREVRQKDFHGSSALRKVPDVMIGVERNMRDPYKCDQLQLRVIKNRWFSKVGFADTLTYFTKTGRLK